MERKYNMPMGSKEDVCDRCNLGYNGDCDWNEDKKECSKIKKGDE